MCGSAPKNYQPVTALLFPLTRHTRGIAVLARHLEWHRDNKDLWTVRNSNIYDAFKDRWPEQNVLELPGNHFNVTRRARGELEDAAGIPFMVLQVTSVLVCFGHRLLVPAHPDRRSPLSSFNLGQQSIFLTTWAHVETAYRCSRRRSCIGTDKNLCMRPVSLECMWKRRENT